METRTSINAKLPDSLLTLFAKERAGRGRMAVQDALEQAITLWLNRPESSSGTEEKAPFSATQKPPTADLTATKNKGELVQQKVVAYETLHTSNPCQSEISLLTQILESGTDVYADAIRASLQAFARAVQLERGGHGAGAPAAGPIDRDAVVGGVLETAQRAIAKSGRIVAKPKDGSPRATERARGDR